ncbi:MAG: carboxypeptidase regulatory-like domain-containing protein [Acidobacteriota bacterium]
MRIRNSSVALAILAFLLLVVGTLAHGQAVSGTIVGTVTDPTGAVVPKAQVTITLTGQSLVNTTVTNESGNFTLPNLPPGTYTVSAAASGFKRETRENIILDTNSTSRVDMSLATGNISETVTVTTAPPLLQTDRADISTKLELRQIADLPLSSGNSFQSLLNTVPGMAPVVFNNSQFYNANNDLSTNANGQSSYVNLYQIEGIDDDQRTGIHIILVPPAAAIANVDITTNNFEAEFGRAVGTVVNVTLKSGTNQIHGSVFQKMENNGVNARNYFATGPNGRLVYNYSGGSIGGPILKDKLFLFADILRVSDHESSTVNATIPYYNVVAGNLNLAGYGGQVYDPNTGDTADCLVGAANPGSCAVGRTAFVGNVIPLSNPGITTVGKTVLQDLDVIARDPKQNLASAKYIAGTLTNNFSQNTPFSKDSYNYDVKSDYAMGPKDHLSGRFSHQSITTYQAPLFGNFLGGPAAGGFEANGTETAYSTGGNYDHTFSPRLLAEFRFGVAHLRNSATQSDYGANDARTLGIPGNGPNGTNNTATTSGQVAFSINTMSNPVIGYSASLPWLRAESNIDFANNWTRLIGNHTLKAGVDIRRVRDDLLQGNNNAAAGQFYFAENQTSAPGNNSTSGANDIASVLFGIPNQVGQDTNSTFPCYRQTWLFFFLSDKWQATPKLTVDLGIRWELYPPATPRKDGGFVNYNPTTNQLVLAGQDGNPSNLGMQSNYKNFAPRLGLSYRLSEKTVIRAGFGVSFVPFVDNTYAYNYPIKTSTGYFSNSTYGPAVNPAGGLVNFTTGIPTTPTAAFSSSGTITETAANGTIGLNNLFIPLDFKNAYVSSWNFVVQQALPFDTSLQVAYVANHGTRIDVSQNINLPRIYGQGAAYDPLNHAADGVTPTFLKTAQVNEFFLGYSTNYESLQVQLTHRFNHSVAFTSAFTWGKAENYQTGAQDGALMFWAGPVHRNWAVADFDRKLNYAQTITWELPAGKGHSHFNSGPLMFALGGWKTSAVIQTVSGLPFTISTGSVTTGTTQTVNQTGPFQVTHAVAGGTNAAVQWFNTTTFAAPAACTAYTPTNQVACALGNTGRNQFRGPAYFSDNLSLFKSFPIFREASLEARFDAFNLTNTPAFGLPNGTFNASPTSSFGKISGTLGSGVGNVNGVGGPRVLQAGVKILF